jgi:hypothetical protein
MTKDISHTEASLALAAVQRRRHEVLHAQRRIAS